MMEERKKEIFRILHFVPDYWEKQFCNLEITPYECGWVIDNSALV